MASQQAKTEKIFELLQFYKSHIFFQFLWYFMKDDKNLFFNTKWLDTRPELGIDLKKNHLALLVARIDKSWQRDLFWVNRFPKYVLKKWTLVYSICLVENTTSYIVIKANYRLLKTFFRIVYYIKKGYCIAGAWNVRKMN